MTTNDKIWLLKQSMLNILIAIQEIKLTLTDGESFALIEKCVNDAKEMLQSIDSDSNEQGEEK